jgi:hypothetical protein
MAEMKNEDFRLVHGFLNGDSAAVDQLAAKYRQQKEEFRIQKRSLKLLEVGMAVSRAFCPMSFCRQADTKEHFSKWLGLFPSPDGRVYLRYCDTWRGGNTGSNRWDSFQFDNRYDCKVTINYKLTTRNVNGEIIGQNYSQTTVEANTMGELINLAPGQTVSYVSIIF